MAVEKEVATFTVAFKELPANMRLFSLSLRSLYAENAVSSSDKAIDINKIRDETRRDAIVYMKAVLPLCTQVVRSIQEFFEYYEVLEYEEWKDCLTDILDEVNGYQQCCTEVVKMHEDMMVPLKKRQDKATLLMSQLKGLSKELKKRSEEFEKYATNARTWATVLAFVPYVNAIATPLLFMHADNDQAVAVAEAKQADINEVAIAVVSKSLIPALSAFIYSLDAVAGFFNVMKEELTSFKGKGEKATQDAKKLHYTMMRKKGEEIKGSSNQFYAMIPGVRTDLQCIPEKPDDKNYVDKWLIEQQERIKKEYSPKITGQLKKMLEM